MSGFFLCWHREGGTLADEVVAVVRARLRARGPEGDRVCRAAGVVAVHSAFTDAIGAEDALPLLAEDLCLAADLRLDDRVRLRAALRDAAAEPPRDAGDDRLLHAALRAWGADATARLIGDFAFAAVDLRHGTLVTARGTMGVKPLFTAETREFVAASNVLDALLALPGVDATPDERAIADFLRSGSIVDPWRTARRGVQRVAPSHGAVWGRTGTGRRSRHWRFPTPVPRAFRDDQELLDGFRETLGLAVRDRLRVPRATIQLSGGLDSPSLAATAREAVPAVALSALTVTHERLVENDERQWAERVATHLALPHEIAFVDVDGILGHLDDPQLRTSEPVADPELAVWRARATTLSTLAPVTIDGEDGDSLLAPPDLPTLLLSRPWIETWRTWRRFRAETGRRPWLGLREWSPARARRLASGWRAPAWLRPAIVERHGEQAPPEPPRHPLRPIAAWSHQQPIWETLFSIDDPDVSGAPLTVVLPFLDARLFEFVFAMPPIPWCQNKRVLRRAMAGRLPDDVLARPKSPVTGAAEAGVAAWRAAGGAERTLAHTMDDLIDVPLWRRTLREAPAADDVLAAWRVFEVARWLGQPEAPRD